MKRFFRFWFQPGPHSQATSIYTYAGTLEEARQKIVERLDDQYGATAVLSNRVEQFALSQCNAFARTSVGIPQSLLPDDVFEVNADLDSVDPAAFDTPTQRVAREFRMQADSLRQRLALPTVGGGSAGKRHRALY